MTSDTFEIGLDEAGYGPLLGPLVIGAVRVDGPLESLRAASRSRRRGVPRITDSKVLYRGGQGLDALEVTALAAWALARGGVPATVADYFGGSPRAAADHPWYGGLDDALPRFATRAAVEDAAARLREGLERTGAAITRAAAFCHLEGTLNERMGELANKADVHLDHVGSALMSVLDAGRGGRINCDRLGGRQDYGPFLSRLFPFVPMSVVEERPRESRYEMGPDASRVLVRFMVNGERRSKEVALASCLAKYGRELMMACFNRTFTARYEGLKATAGYYRDARRFLHELEAFAGAGAGWRQRLARIR